MLAASRAGISEMAYLFAILSGKTMKQGFKPQSFSDIELGMEIEVNMAGGRTGRGIVKYVGKTHPLWGNVIGVELHPGQGKYSSALI